MFKLRYLCRPCDCRPVGVVRPIDPACGGIRRRSLEAGPTEYLGPGADLGRQDFPTASNPTDRRIPTIMSHTIPFIAGPPTGQQPTRVMPGTSGC